MTHPTDTGSSPVVPGAPVAPNLTAWRNAVFVVFTLSGLTLASWISRLPAVRDQLHLDTAAVGLLILCLSAGSVVGLVAAPLILNRIGARRGILFALCVSGLSLAGVGLSATLLPSPGLAMLFLAVLGLANGALDVMMNLEGAGAERAIGRTLLPLMHAFFSLGTVVGAGLGAAASALGIPVSVHLLVVAVLILLVAVVVVRYLPAVVESDEPLAPALPLKARIRESLAVWADVRLLLIGLILLGMAFAEGSANDWVAIATIDGHGQDNTTGAIMFGVFVTAMTVGRVAGGPVLDRLGRVPVLRWSALIGAIGVLLFILSPSLPMAFVGAGLWGIGASLGFPVGISAAADDPQKAAARVSAVAIIGYVAFLAGPPLLGFLGQHFGILNALYVVLALLILAALATPAARERTGKFSRR
ncbi:MULTISPECIES: MFS transporter [Subtercola]|uniref:MFS transporter n=1 Tax=Subtercola vilae TaxID=2056433 RepID=A0A4T2C954_9MICO|nr:MULTISPECIES: MFS transporter [Subtercola]MEA9985419.1 MFS transporter [Subtercola sp. RTI3]TIH40995.1 MFS transporter [Subtercola vilae]